MTGLLAPAFRPPGDGRRARAAALCSLFAVLAWSGDAAADPCLAVPDAGPPPPSLSPGSRFSGPVVHIIDGDGLCVDTGGGPTGWVEVRLADFYAPELSSPEGPAAKRSLEQLSLGRRLECVAQKQSYDRIVAQCRLEGRLLGELLRELGGDEGGRGFSNPAASIEAVSAQAGPSWREALTVLQRLPAHLLALVMAALVAILAAIWWMPAIQWRRRARARRAFRPIQQERRTSRRLGPPKPRGRQDRSARSGKR